MLCTVHTDSLFGLTGIVGNEVIKHNVCTAHTETICVWTVCGWGAASQMAVENARPWHISSSPWLWVTSGI